MTDISNTENDVKDSQPNSTISKRVSLPLVFNQNITLDTSLLIEQYKLYVESANQTSSFRAQANTFFITINTALISFIAGLQSITGRITSYWFTITCLVGILLCISWFVALRSYRTLNSGRFAVIHEMETFLPARVYSREWEIITNKTKNRKKYIRQTKIEQSIPIIFCLFYIAIIVILFTYR
jgi:hypothetical protein